MLIALQFPLADARAFIPAETHRVPAPEWLLPIPFKDFVRSSGPVLPRLGGDLNAWAGEEFYSGARRALRLDHYSIALFGLELGELSLNPYCAFRRFYHDGRAVARMEIGIGLRRRGKGALRALGSADVHKIVAGTLGLDVRISAPGGHAVETQLRDAAEPLAQQYLAATTRLQGGRPHEADAWWLEPGTPMGLLEYRVDDLAGIPPHSRAVSLPEGSDLRLHYCRMRVGALQFGFWLLGWGTKPDRDKLRKLRLHLFRLHAEFECLKCILRTIAGKKLQVGDVGSEAFDQLQQYLRDSMRLLKRESRYGLPQSAILEAAQDFEDIVTPGQRATLLEQLARVRTNVLGSVRQFTDTEARRSPSLRVVGSGNTIFLANEQKIGEQIVSEYEIRFGDHATIHGDFVFAQSIQGSFNSLKDSGAGADLRGSLEELAKSVAEMGQHLPNDKAREVARDLEVLTKEAISDAPRRKWWELSVDGIKDAATALGEIAKPVLTCLAKVVALLA